MFSGFGPFEMSMGGFPIGFSVRKVLHVKCTLHIFSHIQLTDLPQTEAIFC